MDPTRQEKPSPDRKALPQNRPDPLMDAVIEQQLGIAIGSLERLPPPTLREPVPHAE